MTAITVAAAAPALTAIRTGQNRHATGFLWRGDLVITVFGAGSTGKTSLIRSLLGELVGTVGAPMGSTTTSARYRLRLSGLERAVILEDTPGILEGGPGGREREELARRQAARADLLLLVVDSSEYRLDVKREIRCLQFHFAFYF